MTSENPTTPPRQQPAEPSSPQSNTAKEGTSGQIDVPIVPQITPSPPTSTQTEKDRNNRVPRWKKIAEIVAVSAGVVYAIVAFFQWQAMLTSNQINRDSLVSVQRAFVTFHTVQQVRLIRRYPSGDQHVWDFAGIIDNSGNTPAVQVIRYFGSGSDMPNEEQFKGDKSNKFRVFTIGPKATELIGPREESELDIFGKELGSDPGKTFTSTSTVNHFFWGWITYRDTFPKTDAHLTEFCQRLSEITLTADARNFQFLYTSCPSANHDCTDEYCKDYQQIEDFARNALKE